MAETFNRASVALSTASITDVYQAPNIADANRAVVLSCLVANVDGSASCDVTITIANSGDTEIAKLANTIQVPADASLEVIANKLVLKRGEKIRATASAGGDLHVTVSALEIS
jgi:hypothetical protein